MGLRDEISQSILQMLSDKKDPLDSFYASKEMKEGDRVRVDLTSGEIFDLTQKKKYSAKPIPAFMQELLRDGGLIRHLRKSSLKRKR